MQHLVGLRTQLGSTSWTRENSYVAPRGLENMVTRHLMELESTGNKITNAVNASHNVPILLKHKSLVTVHRPLS